MEISQTPDQLRALATLQANCEIDEINLLSCTANRLKSGTSLKPPFSAKQALTNVVPTLRPGSLAVEISFDYSAWDSSEPPARLFSVRCTFEATYLIRAGYQPTEEEVSCFSRGTAVFNCWSYAREFIRDITSRLGQQPPALPLLRIVPKPSTQDQPVIEAPLNAKTIPANHPEAIEAPAKVAQPRKRRTETKGKSGRSVEK